MQEQSQNKIIKTYPVDRVKAFLIMNDIKFITAEISPCLTKLDINFKFTNTSMHFSSTNKDEEKCYLECVNYINEMNEIYKQVPIGEFVPKN